MKAEKLDEVRALLDNAKRLEGIVPKYREAIKNSSCDKHQLAFSAGSDMSVFCVQVGLTCYTGYYGNSSCSRMTTVENPTAQKYLVAALNKHMEMILNTMASLVRADAAKLKAEAQREIDAAAQLLKEIDQEQVAVG